MLTKLYAEWNFALQETRTSAYDALETKTIPGADNKYFPWGTVDDPNEVWDSSWPINDFDNNPNSGFDYFQKSLGRVFSERPADYGVKAPGFESYNWGPFKYTTIYVDENELAQLTQRLPPEQDFINDGAFSDLTSAFPSNLVISVSAPPLSNGSIGAGVSVNASISANYGGVSLLQSPGEFFTEAVFGLANYIAKGAGLTSLMSNIANSFTVATTLKTFHYNAFNVLDYGVQNFETLDPSEYNRMADDLLRSTRSDFIGALQEVSGVDLNGDAARFVTGVNLTVGPLEVGATIETSIGAEGLSDAVYDALPTPDQTYMPRTGGVKIVGEAAWYVGGSTARDVVINLDSAADKAIYDEAHLFEGNDVFLGGDWWEIVRLGPGSDTTYAAGGNDIIYGDGGVDTVYAEDGDDEVYGGDGADFLFGGADNDFISGGDGSDSLYREDGADTIAPGLGVDTMIGGLGIDRFSGTVSELGGDTIAYFEAGETIEIRGSTVSLADISVSNGAATITLRETPSSPSEFLNVGGDFENGGFQISYGNGNSSVTWTPSNPVEPIEPIDPYEPTDPVEPTDPYEPIDPVEPTDPPQAPSNDTTSDFNGDGTDDVAWRNDRTGQLVVWTIDDGRPTYEKAGSASSAWRSEGLGDFNGDGTDDILWRHSHTGEVVNWAMDGARPSYEKAGTAGDEWTIEGTGDFNGDGAEDILWRNFNSGDVVSWVMGGGRPSYEKTGNANFAWTVEATGDFDGDGTDDILWRNSNNGEVVSWTMGGDRPSYDTTGHANLEWTVEGAGDFNGDGTDDVLWRNVVSGDVVSWAMRDGRPSYERVGNASSDWSVEAAGDFNGGGADDILWRNGVNGDVVSWAMEDGRPSYERLGNAAVEWRAVGADDDFYIFV